MNPAIAIEHTKGWVYTTVGELYDRHGGEAQTGPFGSQLHAVDYQAEGGTPVIMPVDIRDRRIDTARIARIGERKKSELARHQVREGDVLFARRGDVGRFAVVSEQESGWICGTGCLRVRLNTPDVHSAFLAHYFGRSEVKEWLLREAKGTTMPNLNTSILRKLPLVLPPLAEQRRIAAILDQTESLRVKRRHALAQLDTLTQSLFLDLFGDPATNAKSWNTVFLYDLLALPLRNGLSPSNSGAVKAKVLTLSAITGDTFRADAWKEAPFQSVPPLDQRVDAADLLICRGNGNIQLVGKGYFPPCDMPDLTFPDTMIAARISSDCIVPRFLQVLWNGSSVRRQIESLARTTNGTFKVNQTILESIRLVAPSLPLQCEFATQVSTVERLKAAQRVSLVKLDALFASLQHRAFRGEL